MIIILQDLQTNAINITLKNGDMSQNMSLMMNPLMTGILSPTLFKRKSFSKPHSLSSTIKKGSFFPNIEDPRQFANEGMGILTLHQERDNYIGQVSIYRPDNFMIPGPKISI